ncbi:MAG: hypothetical protein GF381_03620 [Candidatus Pacebacteria bacterium]|nr:hypothetical protein [Candidatus Paceibacterota bacterium]
MKKLWLVVLFLLAGLAFGLVWLTMYRLDVHQRLLALPDREQVWIKLGSQKLLVEVVNTPSSRTQGLSGREQVGGKSSQVQGMLFVFPQSGQPWFWMKEMKFDLDLVWIDHNQVQEVTPNVPAPSSEIREDQLPFYSPTQSVKMVLEVPAQQYQFMPGDKFKLISQSSLLQSLVDN